MSRRKRAYLPGVVFHVTARTHCKEHYFANPPMRNRIVEILCQALNRSDAELIAYAVLSNHYHLVLHQGNAQLAQLLHPINRQIALAVQRQEGRKGHVFERRFFAKPCADAAQMREMIVYTHRNPVRAQQCDAPGNWPWSSHCAYARTPYPTRIEQPRVRAVLELFADDASPGEGLAGYERYMEWRSACDALPEDAPRPSRPRTICGDKYYSEFFTATPVMELEPEVDLRDVVARSLRETAPDLTLDYIRLPIRSRPMAAIRRTIIQDALRARHRNANIAKFLRISEGTVSRVAATMYPRPFVRHDN